MLHELLQGRERQVNELRLPVAQLEAIELQALEAQELGRSLLRLAQRTQRHIATRPIQRLPEAEQVQIGKIVGTAGGSGADQQHTGQAGHIPEGLLHAGQQLALKQVTLGHAAISPLPATVGQALYRVLPRRVGIQIPWHRVCMDRQGEQSVGKRAEKRLGSALLAGIKGRERRSKGRLMLEGYAFSSHCE